MNDKLRVKTDHSLVRDLKSNAIINSNNNEYEKFLEISKIKYEEKKKIEDLKKQVEEIKNDLNDIKILLKSIVCKWFINI